MSSPRSSKKRTVLKVTLLVLGVPLLLLVGFFGWLFTQFPSPQGKRLTLEKKLVGVQAMSYAWILRTAKGVVLIDTGVDKEAKAIRAELKKMGLTPKDVHTILLTHGHNDHIAGALAFPRAQVWIGPGERALVQGKAPAGGLFQRTLSVFGNPPRLPQTLQELKDDELLQRDGETFRVLHTPGHTQGSVMYLWNNILFSGDTIMAASTGVRTLPWVMMESLPQTHQSLRKLLPLSFQTMADGHAGLTLNAHTKLQRFLQTL